MPFSYYIIGCLTQFLLVASVRFGYRYITLERTRREQNSRAVHNAMITGAGAAGQGTRAGASDARAPWPGGSTLTVCRPASAAAAAKNAASAWLPPWPWR